MTQADHRERKKERAAPPNRSPGVRPGDVPTSTRLASVPGTLPSLHSRGLAAPVRRETRASSVPLAPLPPHSLTQDLPFPERNRLEMRAPTTGTWKTQSVSPSLSRSLRRNRGHCRASSRLATSRPPPQPPRARARGVPEPGTPYRARTAAPAEAGRASSTGSSLGPPWEPAGLEKGRPEERQTPLPVQLHLLHVAHNAPATAPGG